MPAARRSAGRFLLLLLWLLPTVACRLPADLLAPNPARWQRTAAGIEWQILKPGADELAQMLVARIDPRHFPFRVLYQPGAAQGLSAWRELAPAASLLVNANFFDKDQQALGLVLSDGVAYGEAYRHRGGTFLVKDGLPALIANRGRNLPLAGVEQAVQGFPLLADNGAPGYSRAGSAARTRRTVIADDEKGRLLIIVAPYWGLSLRDLSAYLASAGLGIQQALNLDGGGSTMIALPDADYYQPSLEAVPGVLAVYPKE